MSENPPTLSYTNVVTNVPHKQETAVNT